MEKIKEVSFLEEEFRIEMVMVKRVEEEEKERRELGVDGIEIRHGD